MRKEVLVGIDLAKLLCAIIVVFGHTFCYDSCWGGWIKSVLFEVCVPFFFIASGFFLFRGMERNATTINVYVKKYLNRLCSIYIVWSILTIYVSYYNLSLAHANYSWWMIGIHMIRQFFFSGSMGVYWYILALIYSTLIIYWIGYKKGEYNALTIVSFLGYVLGVCYSRGMLSETLLGSVIHIVFGSQKNTINEGCFYMMLGVLIAKKNISLQWWWSALLFVLAVVLATILLPLRLGFMQMFEALFLFLWMKKWNPSSKGIKSNIIAVRKCSIAIYLIHFPFIIMFDYYLNKGTIIDFSLTLFVSFVLFIGMSKIIPDKYLQYVFG